MATLLAWRHLSVYALVLFLSGLARSQQNCSEITTCSACIGSAGCIWCSIDSFPSNLARCDYMDNNFGGICPQNLENPQNVFESVPLTLNQMNQVSLESVNLKLKVGEPETFNVSVRAAENFPLDLYLLMDLSGSFTDDLATVQTIAPELFASLFNVTTEFRVGFGAFVDKPTPPYSSISQLREQLSGGACGGSSRCSAPFSYEHLTPFTSDQDEFANAIKNVDISATADDPEGTLDAMIQATVCTDIIGWDQDARKILLVITDDLMHLAGDGSLAGINQPNDAVCRTSKDSETGKTLYMAALEYDYPSVEQVRSALFDFDIVPVIAIGPVGADKRVVIIDIATEIGAITVDLAMSSNNLVQRIREAYEMIVNQPVLDFTAPEFLTVDVVPDCPPGSNQTGLSCLGIGDGVATFVITVTLNECTEEVTNGNSYPLEVNVRGFDRFVIEVSGLCICDCAQPSQVDFNSTLCSERGDYVCGVCECPSPFTGATCDCNPTLTCPVINDLECSGPTRGMCDGCGQCLCESQFSGSACECSSLGCDCSGNGDCTFCFNNNTQSCNCSEGFYGANCECTLQNCIDSADLSGVLCSGNGVCNDCPPRGCECNEQTHVGEFCHLEVAANPGCMGAEACIVCAGDAAMAGVNITQIAGCEDLGPPCNTYMPIERVDSFDEFQFSQDIIGSPTECLLSTIQCQYTYYQALSLITGQPIYEVEPPSCLLIPWWAIPIIIILGLFVLGVIILVLAQIILRWLDYRELKHFEKEVQEADFTKNVNPVYQAPTMTYDNPLHGKPI